MRKALLSEHTSGIKLQEKKLSQMGLTITLLFIVCNSVYSIHYIMKAEHKSNVFEKLFVHSTARIFAMVNCSTNFIIYWIFNPKFKETLVSIFNPTKAVAKKNWSIVNYKLKTVDIVKNSAHKASGYSGLEISVQEITKPKTTKPETTEPETAESETPEPKTPKTKEPETTEPETTVPETTKPETIEPETTEPETPEPDPETPGPESPSI